VQPEPDSETAAALPELPLPEPEALEEVELSVDEFDLVFDTPAEETSVPAEDVTAEAVVPAPLEDLRELPDLTPATSETETEVEVEAEQTPATEPESELAPEPEPEPELGSESAAVEPPAVEAAEPADDEVKIIGPLRIAIPLFNIFLNEADEQSRRLGTEIAEWSLEPHRPVGDSTIALAHSLAGNSGTVGFTDLSVLARSLE
ncbi:MAG: Hpt domain-containing protein, partial [Cyanobacteria bacterium HKST-UBA01]|nr:Hpt domain-containing protein [Cyanobacteria bacterium HKST-UBA01]